MAALRSTLDAFWTTELEELASAASQEVSAKKGSPDDD
jgi:hypothetical protein